jgi:thymidylate synthase ThyX
MVNLRENGNGVRKTKLMDKTYNINQIDAVFDLLVSDSPYLKKSWTEYYNKEYKDNRERLCILI